MQHLGEERSFKIVDVKCSLDQSSQGGLDKVPKFSPELEEGLSKLSLNKSQDLNDSSSFSPVEDCSVFKITAATDFKINMANSVANGNKVQSTSLSEVGGLEMQIQLLSDLILHPLEATRITGSCVCV